MGEDWDFGRADFMHRSEEELAQADAEARPYYLYLLAMGWQNVTWTYQPPYMYRIHSWEATGEYDGKTWEGSSPVSPKQALLSMKWHQEGRLPYRP